VEQCIGEQTKAEIIRLQRYLKEACEANCARHVQLAEFKEHVEAERRRYYGELAAVEQACVRAVAVAENSHTERIGSLEGELAERVTQVGALEHCEDMLRTELGVECSAMRRVCHRAEERQWRHQALLDHAKQHAEESYIEMQELRRSLRVSEEGFEQQIREEQRQRLSFEAELAEERMELRSVIRSQLAEVAPRISWQPNVTEHSFPQACRQFV